MEYLVFDVETSGLSSQDEVWQFAGLLIDQKFTIKKVINFYCFTQVGLDEKVKEITGMTTSELHRLSNDKYFEDYYYALDIFKKKDIIWCGYNSDAFDIRMINQTLESNGLPFHDFGDKTETLQHEHGTYHLDLMNVDKRIRGALYARKLTACEQDLGIAKESINKMFVLLQKKVGQKVDVTNHNALYDALITFLLMNKYRELI